VSNHIFYNNNNKKKKKKKKSSNIHQQKTLILTLAFNLNHNLTMHNRRFYQVKLENYGINVMRDKNRSRKVKTSRDPQIPPGSCPAVGPSKSTKRPHEKPAMPIPALNPNTSQV